MARPKKWTDERIEALAADIEAWYADNDAYLWGVYMTKHKLPLEYISRFSSVNSTFRQTIKRVEALQEQRLVEQAMRNKANAAVAIFVLKNKHGYADKQEQRVISENTHQHTVNAADLTPEQLRDRIFMLTERQGKN